MLEEIKFDPDEVEKALGNAVVQDEPIEEEELKATGVDPVSRRDFWSILAALIQEKGMTALVSTAYMDEAERFHRLSFLSGGKVLASGMPMEVRSLVPGSIVTFEVNPQLEAIALLKKSFRQVESLGPLLHVFIDTADQSEARVQIEAALGDLVPSGVRVDQPELEDVFVALLLRNTEHKETPGGLPTSAGVTNHDGSAIEAEGLIRDFGSFRAVDRVSRVKQGEIFGLLGANGAGKTTDTAVGHTNATGNTSLCSSVRTAMAPSLPTGRSTTIMVNWATTAGAPFRRARTGTGRLSSAHSIRMPPTQSAATTIPASPRMTWGLAGGTGEATPMTASSGIQ